MSCLCFSLCFYRNHTSVLTASVFTFLENHHTVCQGIKRMVFAHTYIGTGIVNCAALANNDVTCYALLSTENLYA